MDFKHEHVLDKRYLRQLILKEVGKGGQKKLSKARVLIVGAGGLGSPAALYLCAAGVGTIGLVDCDVVDMSNLQRQILHATESVGQEKVFSARDRLLALNPHVKINTYSLKLDQSNAEGIIENYDLILNAVDNVEARYVVNDVCLAKRIPIVEGAIYNFEGYVMSILPGESPCYRCIFPNDQSLSSSKEMIGVIGCIAGIVGTMQAMEAIKHIIGIGRVLAGKMLYYNTLESRFREIEIGRNPECRCAI